MSLNILSAIQFKPKLATCQADIRDNFRNCESLIHIAYKLGSNLVVFPELCLTGYNHMSPEDAFKIAESIDGPTFKQMRGIALSLKAVVAWGYVEIDKDGRLYNSATMVGPDGLVITNYRKINLFSCDFLWARPGDRPATIVDTEFGKTSIVICRDLRNKIPTNIPRTASDDQGESGTNLWSGAKIDLVAACTNWGKGGGYPPTTFMDFAANVKCTVVVADRWGDEMSSESHGEFVSEFGSGKSVIITKDWNVHTDGMIHNSNCVVSAAL